MISNKFKSPQAWRNKGARLKTFLRPFFNFLKGAWHFAGKVLSKKGKKSGLVKAVRLAAIGFGFLILAGGIAGVAALGYYSKDLPDPDKLIDRQVVESTKIFDRTGEHLLYEIHDDVKRTIVRLEDLPDYIPQSIIALEDKNFYTHHGLALKRILLAVYSKITNGDGPGASTLTQQLVKNAILTPERTISRKLKEWVLTLQIERNFSKDEILQLYINEIPFGSTAYGIEAAANLYFGKQAKDISLAEAAVLAAIIKRPTYYSPFGSNKDKLLERQQLVLALMEAQNYITKEDAEKAKEEKVQFKSKKEAIEAPHFVFYVKEQLTNNYGEKVVEQGGLRVYTTLDYDLQKKAEAAVVEGAEKNLKFAANNAALVAVDPKNGEVLAMVGSKDYFDTENDGNVNVALSQRQPGSSFKPIVYAASFIKGYTPETVLYDVVTTFKTETKDYTPHNYDNKEHGPVTMRQALAGSLNVPAVKTLYLAGINRVLDLAQDLGYTSLEDRSRFGLSLVLGGGEVRLIEHVMAFSAFANDGVKNDQPISILKVEDKSGRVLEEAQYSEKKVLSKDVARQINSVLSDNNARAYVFGTRNNLGLKDRPVAAKTGTTNDFHDAWTIGYTPQLVAGVWVGNNNNDEMKRGADGSIVAAPIWNKFMSEALKDKEVLSFGPAPANKTEKPVLRGEKIGEKTLRIDRASGLLATDFTPATFVEEKTFVEHHDILHYVYKDNPNGPAPENPAEADLQYVHWEAAVQRWAVEQSKDKPVVTVQPPTEYDNLHVPENRPNLVVLSPNNNQMIKENSLSVQISASAPRGIYRSEFYIDDLLVAVMRNAPFNLDGFSLLNYENGFHDLKVKVFDDIDNSTDYRLTFNLLADKPALLTSWLTPINFSSFTAADFPVTLNLTVNKPQNVQQIIFYYVDVNGQKHIINSLQSPSEASVMTQWASVPPTGNYRLIADLQTNENQLLSSDAINVAIKN